MSFRIVDEVLDHIPAGATASDRLVAVVIAHHAHEKTRECWPGMPRLTSSTGMHPESIRRSLVHLAELGLNLRATNAYKGHSTVYRVPRFAESGSHSPNYSLGQQSGDSPNRLLGQSAAKPQQSIDTAPTDRRHSPNELLDPEGKEPKERGNRDLLICPRHPNGDDGTPCGTCADIRKHSTSVNTVPSGVQPPREVLNPCTDCTGIWMIDPDDGRTVGKCDLVTVGTCSRGLGPSARRATATGRSAVAYVRAHRRVRRHRHLLQPPLSRSRTVPDLRPPRPPDLALRR